MINTNHTQVSTRSTSGVELAGIDSFLNGAGKNREPLYVNISAMCRAFEKCAADFLRLNWVQASIRTWAEKENLEPGSFIAETMETTPDVLARLPVAVECAFWASQEFCSWFYSYSKKSRPAAVLNYPEIVEALSAEVQAARKKEARSGYSGALRPLRRVRTLPLLDENEVPAECAAPGVGQN